MTRARAIALEWQGHARFPNVMARDVRVASHPGRTGSTIGASSGAGGVGPSKVSTFWMTRGPTRPAANTHLGFQPLP